MPGRYVTVSSDLLDDPEFRHLEAGDFAVYLYPWFRGHGVTGILHLAEEDYARAVRMDAKAFKAALKRIRKGRSRLRRYGDWWWLVARAKHTCYNANYTDVSPKHAISAVLYLQEVPERLRADFYATYPILAQYALSKGYGRGIEGVSEGHPPVVSSVEGVSKGHPPVPTDSESDSESESVKIKSTTKSQSKESSAPKNQLPTGIEDLELYRTDKRLLKQWDGLMKAWEKAFPKLDIMAEIREAHAWEVANPTRRKKQRSRFLTNWLMRSKPDSDKPLTIAEVAKIGSKPDE